MSAFMMSNKTLSMLSDFIARYYINDGRDFSFYFPQELEEELGPFPFIPENVFQTLASLNIESLRMRYPDSYEEMIGDVRYIPGHNRWRNDVYDIEHGCNFMCDWHYQILKSFDCYLYQSCEGNCYKLPLYKAIESLRDKWGYYIASNQPEYEEADWD